MRLLRFQQFDSAFLLSFSFLSFLGQCHIGPDRKSLDNKGSLQKPRGAITSFIRNVSKSPRQIQNNCQKTSRESLPFCALPANTGRSDRRERSGSPRAGTKSRASECRSVEIHCNGCLHLHLQLSFLVGSQPLVSTPPSLISHLTVPANREKKQRAVCGNSGEIPMNSLLPHLLRPLQSRDKSPMRRCQVSEVATVFNV
jgi:hypothetical protein